MKSKKTSILAGFIICIALMFLLIPICVVLTGGKELDAFNKADWTVYSVFVAAEVINFVVLFVFAFKLGKENAKNIPPAPKTNRDKHLQLRGWGIFICAYILSLGCFIGGIVLKPILPIVLVTNAGWIFGVLCATVPVLMLADFLLSRIYFSRFKKQNVRQVQQYMLSHRENASRTATQKLRFLKRWRTLTNLYVIFLALVGVGLCLFGSIVAGSSWRVPVMFYSFFLFLCSISRLQLPTPSKVYDDEKTLITPTDYPTIYAIARKAADALGCTGDIKIFLLSDGAAGIASEHNYHCIFLNGHYISLLTEDELYCIMLHEFCHAKHNFLYDAREVQHSNWLRQGGNPHYLSGLTGLLHRFGDTVYSFHFMLYSYASAISTETEADAAMVAHGDAATAASALIKLKYMDLFDWESGTYDAESIYKSQEADPQLATHQLEKLKQAIIQRADAWNKLINVEIISRSASHPTLKMRLDALGIHSHQTLVPDEASVFAAECRKAMGRLDEQIYEPWKEEYDKLRQEQYLEPLALIEKWESGGFALVEESYADILQALRSLGRNLDADRLSCRAIEEFTGAAANFAHFMHGSFLLHRYDATGLNHIYHAMENNSNYIEEGLNMIGAFCCLTGNQEELDCYREKALELAQKKKDVYDEYDSLRKTDQLSAESLPEGMLERILDYIHSVGQNAISHVYLVRKTISHEHFTSVFVIRFRLETDSNVEDEVMHQIFNHLDACYDWQFSLYEYMDVYDVKVDKIENSCVFSAENK